jgi:DNA-directed RNA polymerase subunit RPC12/RpoP
MSTSFLRSTGQLWKLLLAISITVLVAVPLFVIGNYLRHMLVVMAGSVVTFAAFAWLVNSVKCPQCSAKVLWISASREPASDWTSGQVSAISRCPQCGYQPTGAGT